MLTKKQYLAIAGVCVLTATGFGAFAMPTQAFSFGLASIGLYFIACARGDDNE